MPADAAHQLRMTATEYLAWEREQPERHEFLHGEVFSIEVDAIYAGAFELAGE
jgi:hypothetical protein